MNCYREILKLELQNRQTINASYSLRSFARDLNLYPSHLSDILNGHKGLSVDKAQFVAEQLGLSFEESKKFKAMVTAKHAAKKKDRLASAKELESQMGDDELEEEVFHAISDYRYFGTWVAMHLSEFDGTLDWLVDYTNISTKEMKGVLATLDNLGFVKTKNTKFLPTQTQLKTKSDFESFALKASHRQSLNQAIDAIVSTPVDKRDITSMTMAVDLKKMDWLKTRVREFRQEVSDYMESGETTDVYNLNIQFVPLFNSKDLKEK